MNFQDALAKYLQTTNKQKLALKTVLFDMDGVLFNSMPSHAKSWLIAMKTYNLPFTEYDCYLNEGRTGENTVNYFFNKKHNRDATEKELQHIYKIKTDSFETFPPAERIPFSFELTQQIKAQNLDRLIVTGSGQRSLWKKIESNFPEIFDSSRMVTSFDVKYGKPHPEPYLIGLERANSKAEETIVIENAPLGIQSAKAAGVFVIAVQTGILEDKILHDAGADLVFSSMEDLCNKWEELSTLLLSKS